MYSNISFSICLFFLFNFSNEKIRSVGLEFSDFKNAHIIIGYIKLLIILIISKLYRSLIYEGKHLEAIQG